jgi:hypothetical protein
VRILRRSLLLFILADLSGCATAGASLWNTGAASSEVVQKVLASGRSLIGKKPDAKVTVNGKPFILDCIGTVSAAWWGAGLDLRREFRRYPGDGVNRLYRSLQSWGALHWQRTPQPGDLIIWDHTWDVDGDPNYPDGHTHAGMVLSVAADGTIEYLHESVSRGVVVAYMNLYDTEGTLGPGGKVINSPLYQGSNYGKSTNPARWTSGHLWSAFGDAETVARVLAGS